MTDKQYQIFDITVIGAGPVGLYGLYYASIREMKAKIVDSMPQVGGQLMALYPEKYIYDVPGFAKVLAKDLIHRLEEQALQNDPEVCLGEKITSLRRDDAGVFTLESEAGNVHRSRSVLIAAGVGAFMPRKLDVARIDELEGRGVYYSVANPSDFHNKKVVIVGGGDSAFDWGLHVQPFAREVMLIHRSDQYRAHERSVRDLRSSGAIVRPFCELKAVHGEERVEAITIFDNRTGDEEEHGADVLLMNIGFVANLGPIKTWGLEIVKNTIAVDSSLLTSIPGVFAAGDVASHPGRLKLISVGAAEAAIAVNNAKRYVDPSARVEPGHSSDRDSENGREAAELAAV